MTTDQASSVGSTASTISHLSAGVVATTTPAVRQRTLDPRPGRWNSHRWGPPALPMAPPSKFLSPPTYASQAAPASWLWAEVNPWHPSYSFPTTQGQRVVFLPRPHPGMALARIEGLPGRPRQPRLWNDLAGNLLLVCSPAAHSQGLRCAFSPLGDVDAYRHRQLAFSDWDGPVSMQETARLGRWVDGLGPAFCPRQSSTRRADADRTRMFVDRLWDHLRVEARTLSTRLTLLLCFSPVVIRSPPRGRKRRCGGALARKPLQSPASWVSHQVGECRHVALLAALVWAAAGWPCVVAGSAVHDHLEAWVGGTCLSLEVGRSVL
jgi:hypothetical protein